jgi:DNA polymerase I
MNRCPKCGRPATPLIPCCGVAPHYQSEVARHTPVVVPLPPRQHGGALLAFDKFSAERDSERRAVEPARAATPVPTSGRMVIVDAHNHAVRAFHGIAPMHSGSQPTHAVYGLAGLLWRLVFEERPDYLAVVFDSVDESRTTFRSKLFPAYKGQRGPRPPDLQSQMPLLRELTEAFGLAVLEHSQFEADDLAATVVAMAERANLETVILSSDKDLMQLVTERTTLWDSMRGHRYTPDAVKEKLGVTPGRVVDYLALVGDSSDNVPGVAGIGPTGALRLLGAFGDLDGVLAPEAQATMKPRDRKLITDGREAALMARELMRLRADVEVPALESYRLPVPDPARLSALLRRLGFNSFGPVPRLRPPMRGAA